MCALANFLFDYRVYKHLRMTDSPVFLFHLLIEFHLLKTPPRGHLANCLDFMFSNQIQYWDIFFFFLGCMFWGYIHLTSYNLVIRRSMIDNVYEKNFLAGIFFFQFGLITLRLNWWILLKKIFSLSFFFLGNWVSKLWNRFMCQQLFL